MYSMYLCEVNSFRNHLIPNECNVLLLNSVCVTKQKEAALFSVNVVIKMET